MLKVTRDLGQKYVWNMEEEWLEKAETPKARLLEGICQDMFSSPC